MAANMSNAYEIKVEDVEYLRHGDKPLLARLYRPAGKGPFPGVVDVHGGAWYRGDRLMDDRINTALAQSGVVVAALDFRMPPETSYPGSAADINYGVRWLKANAAEFGVRPDLVGFQGNSSGGHQVALLGMRPRDTRYAAIEPPRAWPAVDASVRFVVALWPVIDPLARYHYAKLLREKKLHLDFADVVLPGHDQYWKTEAAMAEGSPALILERGEKVELPPMLYIQGTTDRAHPRVDLDRFVAAYRKAGGQLELEMYEGEAEGFIVRTSSPRSAQALEKIVEFVHRQAR